MKKIASVTAAALCIGACGTLSDEFYAQQSTPYLCQMAEDSFRDQERAEAELIERRGQAWLNDVKSTRVPYIGAHICTAIYHYGAPLDRNVTSWRGGRSTQWVFGWYPLGLFSTRPVEIYIYTDGGETISAIQR
jgi:hypothetical protein